MKENKTKKKNTEEEVGADSTVTITWQMYNSDDLYFLHSGAGDGGGGGSGGGGRGQEAGIQKVTEGGNEQQDNTAFRIG